LSTIGVAPVPGTGLGEPLSLLEEALRDGEPVPAAFAEGFRGAVEARDLEVLAARVGDRLVGVAVLAYRPSVAAGGLFVSIEDLYVRPQARRRGVGRALLEAVGERCEARRISYVEAQVEAGGAEAFYAALGYERESGVRVLSKSLAVIDGPARNGDSTAGI
jgi:GNAT superfamily N-acetyltransferase